MARPWDNYGHSQQRHTENMRQKLRRLNESTRILFGLRILRDRIEQPLAFFRGTR